MKPTVTNFRKISFTLILMFATLPNLFSQDYEKDKQEIRKLWYDMSEALINRNWEEYQSYYFQDTTLNIMHPSMKDWAKGWHAVQKRYKPLCDPDGKMDIKVPKANVFDVYIAPGGEFAWALIDQNFIFWEKTIQSWYVMIYRKVDGKWLLNLGLEADLPKAKEK